MKRFRKETYVQPPPVEPDVSALAELADLRRRLEQLAVRVGVALAKIDTEPYERPRELERAAGTATPLSMALRRIASANGALYAAHGAATGKRSVLTLAYLMRAARGALAEAEPAIDAASLPVAAE